MTFQGLSALEFRVYVVFFGLGRGGGWGGWGRSHFEFRALRF